MKLRLAKPGQKAFTLTEVFIIMFVIAILALALTPRIQSPYRIPRAATCTDNLRRMDLAYKVWGGDHDDRYPVKVSVTDGGMMELADGPDAWKVFQVLSNELDSPKILVCPAEARQPSKDFGASFNRTNISYFINLDVTEFDRQSVVMGDDNLEIDGKPVKSGVLGLSTNTPIAWTFARHAGQGNIVWVDGSVQSITNSAVTNWSQTSLATNRLFIP